MRDLVSEDTCALICFCCARRFPYVPQKRHMKIRKVKLLERLVEEEVNALHFCGLTCTQTESIFGLSSYVQKYGQMSEDVHLDEAHSEFADW